MRTPLSGHQPRRAGSGVPPVYSSSKGKSNVSHGSRAACHRGGTHLNRAGPANTFFAQRFQADVPETPGFGTAWNMAISGRCSKDPGKWDTLEHGLRKDRMGKRDGHIHRTARH